MTDLPGWPFLSPPRVQMLKCGKCSREFYSTINYRRHMLLHRRNLNIDKDSTTKNRGLLKAFWDKLSAEESMEILSFKDVSLAGVSGSLIVKELTSLILRPRCTSLPLSYVKAGAALLDIVQARPSRFPISSPDLFGSLDEASEKTFLCAGTAGSLQKYVFDGDAGKIGLEMRNLVACISFLLEQKLVKACLADKDAEALRCQKLLVEEEEAAQRRQAALLEKKRLRKLRQKEQRAKELACVETDESPGDSSPTPSIPNSVVASGSNPETLDISHNPTSSLGPVQNINSEDVETDKSPGDSSPTRSIPNSIVASGSNPETLDISHSPTSSPGPVQTINLEGVEKDHENAFLDVTYQNVEHRTLHRNGRRRVVNSRWLAPRMQKSANGFHAYQNYNAAKPGTAQKHVPYRDFHVANSTNYSNKVWAPKPKSETGEVIYSSRSQTQGEIPPIKDNSCEVLIGSISVTLGNCGGKQKEGNFCKASEGCVLELPMPVENGTHEKQGKIEAVQGIASRATVKLWRPVSQRGNGIQLPTQNCSEASKGGAVPCNDDSEPHLACSADNSSGGCKSYTYPFVENGHQGCLRFSSHVAEAFLAKRWKEAILSDHVKLALFSECKPPEAQDDYQEAIPPSKLDHLCILSGTGKQQESLESLAVIQSKLGSNLEMGSKVKYIPKQRSVT